MSLLVTPFLMQACQHILPDVEGSPVQARRGPCQATIDFRDRVFKFQMACCTTCHAHVLCPCECKTRKFAPGGRRCGAAACAPSMQALQDMVGGEGRARAAQSGRGGKAKVPRRPSSEDLEAPLTDSGAGSPSSTGRVERARGREGATAVAGAGYLSEVQLNQARRAPPPHTHAGGGMWPICARYFGPGWGLPLARLCAHVCLSPRTGARRMHSGASV